MSHLYFFQLRRRVGCVEWWRNLSLSLSLSLSFSLIKRSRTDGSIVDGTFVVRDAMFSKAAWPNTCRFVDKRPLINGSRELNPSCTPLLLLRHGFLHFGQPLLVFIRNDLGHNAAQFLEWVDTTTTTIISSSMALLLGLWVRGRHCRRGGRAAAAAVGCTVVGRQGAFKTMRTIAGGGVDIVDISVTWMGCLRRIDTL